MSRQRGFEEDCERKQQIKLTKENNKKKILQIKSSFVQHYENNLWFHFLSCYTDTTKRGGPFLNSYKTEINVSDIFKNVDSRTLTKSELPLLSLHQHQFQKEQSDLSEISPGSWNQKESTTTPKWYCRHHRAENTSPVSSAGTESVRSFEMTLA